MILANIDSLITEVEATQQDKKESFLSRHKGKLALAALAAGAAGAGYAGYKGHLGRDVQKKIGDAMLKGSGYMAKGTAKGAELGAKASAKVAQAGFKASDPESYAKAANAIDDARKAGKTISGVYDKASGTARDLYNKAKEAIK
jgi:uncharacterized protein HemX